MAASALTPTQLTRAGVVESLTAANADGNYYTNSGKEWVEILNGSASPITVTASGLVDGLTVASLRTWTIAAGARRKIAPLTRDYNDAQGRVNLSYSDVTTVTVGVFYL